MQFYNKTFENVYLKLITESAEEGVQFKYICKDCNTGFTDEDGFAEGDACPCEDCEGTLQEFTVDGLDAQPTAYNADENAEAEDSEDTDECDMQDDDLCDMQDDEFEDDQDEDFQDDDLQDDDLQDDDLEDFQDEDDQDEDLQDDDLCDMQDEDADDEAADEQGEDDAEDEGEAEDGEQPEVKLVSFTTEDEALIELLNQVQNGEIKLVAVPVDFEFDEEEMNENPAITMDTVANFAIDDMDDEQEEQSEEDDQDDAEQSDEESEESEESEDQEIAKESKKKDCCCGAKTAKPTKYGIY